jgi:hypothetical protein
VAEFTYLGMTNNSKTAIPKELGAKLCVRECLPSFGREFFVLFFVVQKKCEVYNIQKYNYALLLSLGGKFDLSH